jgi:hypothetical protein
VAAESLRKASFLKAAGLLTTVWLGLTPKALAAKKEEATRRVVSFIVRLVGWLSDWRLYNRECEDDYSSSSRQYGVQGTNHGTLYALPSSA